MTEIHGQHVLGLLRALRMYRPAHGRTGRYTVSPYREKGGAGLERPPGHDPRQRPGGRRAPRPGGRALTRHQGGYPARSA